MTPSLSKDFGYLHSFVFHRSDLFPRSTSCSFFKTVYSSWNSVFPVMAGPVLRRGELGWLGGQHPLQLWLPVSEPRRVSTLHSLCSRVQSQAPGWFNEMKQEDRIWSNMGIREAFSKEKAWLFESKSKWWKPQRYFWIKCWQYLKYVKCWEVTGRPTGSVSFKQTSLYAL